MNTKCLGLNGVEEKDIGDNVVMWCPRPNDEKGLKPRCGVFLNTVYLDIRLIALTEPWASIRSEVLQHTESSYLYH